MQHPFKLKIVGPNPTEPTNFNRETTLMWLNQSSPSQCPVCLARLKQVVDGRSRHDKKVCPTYHYVGTMDSSGHVVEHTIFMSNDYVTWHTPRGGRKFCSLNWNYKQQNIDWLEFESPLDLESLKTRINKLLWFL